MAGHGRPMAGHGRAQSRPMVPLKRPCAERDRRPSGSSPLPTRAAVAPVAGGDAEDADRVALVLHTSGTTKQPKTVPLTLANLVAGALRIRATLELGPGDICLNLMPLFHIHGLAGRAPGPRPHG